MADEVYRIGHRYTGETDPKKILSHLWGQEVEGILFRLQVKPGAPTACTRCRGKGFIFILDIGAVQRGVPEQDALSRKDCSTCQTRGFIGAVV